MRIKLSLKKENNNPIPINYKYELSAWIYRVLHFGNPEFADWLHKNGYTYESKKFKLFTFSNLYGFDFKVVKDRLYILSEEVSLTVSFMIDDAVQHFILGLFKNQEAVIGDKISQVKFKVNYLERLADPLFTNNMVFKTTSPMIVSKVIHEGEKLITLFLSPDHEEYSSRLYENLQKKFISGFHNNHTSRKFELSPDSTFGLELIGSSRRKKISIKAHTVDQTELIGHEFKFRITAPEHLLKTGYYAGFGEKNSLGFGCVAIQNEYSKNI